MEDLMMEYYDKDGYLKKKEIIRPFETKEKFEDIKSKLCDMINDVVYVDEVLGYDTYEDKTGYAMCRTVPKHQMLLGELARLSQMEPKSLIERALKLTEEVGEVSEAVLSFTGVSGCGYKNKTAEDVIEESIDTIIMAYSIIHSVGANYEELYETFNKKLSKWESKMK